MAASIMCRYCFDEGPPESPYMVAPCRCSGSMKYVHIECLLRWLQQQQQLPCGAVWHCELCNHVYSVGDLMNQIHVKYTNVIFYWSCFFSIAYAALAMAAYTGGGSPVAVLHDLARTASCCVGGPCAAGGGVTALQLIISTIWVIVNMAAVCLVASTFLISAGFAIGTGVSLWTWTHKHIRRLLLRGKAPAAAAAGTCGGAPQCTGVQTRAMLLRARRGAAQ